MKKKTMKEIIKEEMESGMRVCKKCGYMFQAKCPRCEEVIE